MSRFRLYPDAQQHAALVETCNQARFVYNLGLEQRAQYRPGRGPTPGFAEQCRQLTEARRESDWLRSGAQIVQQQALRDLDQAYANFFAGTHRYPTWRRKTDRQGFRIVGDSRTWRVETLNRRWARVLIPKVGWVKFRKSRAIPEAKSFRVTLDRAGRWHVAFAAVPVPIPAPGTGEVVGVDRGVAVSAALSSGEMLHVSGLREKEAERLLRLQRALARSQKGSNRRAVLVCKIARVRARETDRRKDWVEKTSTMLARRFDLIGLENLRIRQMTKSARGTIQEPGRNVQQKAGSNREILKNGWGLLEQRLEHKAPGRVVKVNPAWTSQTCSACGTRDGRSRESQAVFRCVNCGYAENADVNAAIVIRDLAVHAHGQPSLTNSKRTKSKRTTAAGHAVAGRGDRPSGRSVKRQTLTVA